MGTTSDKMNDDELFFEDDDWQSAAISETPFPLDRLAEQDVQAVSVSRTIAPRWAIGAAVAALMIAIIAGFGALLFLSLTHPTEVDIPETPATMVSESGL